MAVERTIIALFNPTGEFYANIHGFTPGAYDMMVNGEWNRLTLKRALRGMDAAFEDGATYEEDDFNLIVDYSGTPYELTSGLLPHLPAHLNIVAVHWLETPDGDVFVVDPHTQATDRVVNVELDSDSELDDPARWAPLIEAARAHPACNQVTRTATGVRFALTAEAWGEDPIPTICELLAHFPLD